MTSLNVCSYYVKDVSGEAIVYLVQVWKKKNSIDFQAAWF